MAIMDIYNAVMIIVFMVLGAYSITLKMEDIKALQENAKSKNIVVRSVMNKFLKPIRYSNSLIGRSIEKNSTILFGWALIILFLYYLVFGLILFVIKYVVFTILQMDPTFNLIESFSLLFGAGIMSFLTWLKRLQEKQAETDKKSSIMNIAQSFYLFFNLGIWATGEIVFLLFSEDYAYVNGPGSETTWFLKIMVILIAIFALFVVFRLIKHGIKNKKLKIIVLVVFYPIFALYMLAIILNFTGS